MPGYLAHLLVRGEAPNPYQYNMEYYDADPSGHFALTAIATILDQSMLTSTITAATSTYNYAYNGRYKFTANYIYDQEKGNASKLRMGFWNGAYNGCAWVATFNVNVMLKMVTHPRDIIYFYEHWGAIAWGAFGVMPDAVADYYRIRGRRVKMYMRMWKGMDNAIKKSKACILLYKNRGSASMHYIALRWDGRRSVAYNWGNRSRAEYFTSMEYMVWYYKYTPIALICIN